MNQIYVPQGYRPPLDAYETQRAIAYIKEAFQEEFSGALNLKRVSAPLFVTDASGLNDNLNGYERPVSFDIPAVGMDAEVVHSLAKWKRLALKRYGFGVGQGLYTDMNAIRRDEELDNLHSVYVDQWDWEKVITKEQRTEEYLIKTVKEIYGALKQTARTTCYEFPSVDFPLADDIFFVTSQELEDTWPDLTPKQREHAICAFYKSVFIMRIGDKLKSGKPHDGRAPDYDDWQLNGDILVWNDVLHRSFELSSMGIRVDEKSLREQLEKSGCQDRAELDYHKKLLAGELPYTIGGGIGQSRLCMLMLRCAHIGEVHAAVWPKDMIETCRENNIFLL